MKPAWECATARCCCVLLCRRQTALDFPEMLSRLGELGTLHKLLAGDDTPVASLVALFVWKLKRASETAMLAG